MTTRPTNIDLTECLRSILLDWLDIHPEDRSEVERDLTRIAFEFKARGLPFFTIDLPAIGKILDRSLDQGLLVRSTMPHMRRRWKGKPIPRLFSGFWLRLFGLDGRLVQDPDPTCILFLRTLLYLGKKIKLECKEGYVIDAVSLYYQVEEELPPPSPNWSNNFQDLTGLTVSLTDILGGPDRDYDLFGISDGVISKSLLNNVQLIADRLVSEIPFIELEDLKPKHGPGAVSEKPLGGYKYNFPSWSPRLEEVMPFLEFGTHSCDAVLESSIPTLFPDLRDEASKLIAVPKTQKGPRLIASEPVCNQWAQQAIASPLRRAIQHTTLGRSIDFFDQKPSQDAVLVASRDGHLGTIDLSSASDRLTCWLVERVFRRNLRLLTLFSASRTAYLRNPTYRGFPELIKLKKFASMGSALTFPVQSIVFASLAIGYGSAVTGSSLAKCAEQVRVFGDDIIIPKVWVAGFSELLEKLYLKVNYDKSFSEGNFRESCGMDAWGGYDVTPVYIREPSGALHTRAALGFLDSINNAFLKGFWRLSKYLESTVAWSRKLLRVNCRSRAFGLASFCSGYEDPTGNPVVLHPDYQSEVIRAYRLIGGKPRVDQVESWNPLLSFFVSRDDEDDRLSYLEGRVHDVPLQSVVESGSRMPARVCRTWVPIASLVS